VVFQGTLDLSTRVNGQTSFIGLNDKTSLADGHGGGTGDLTWTAGANIYVHANSEQRQDRPKRNSGGGEYVQKFHTLQPADIPSDGIIAVTFVIDGTADPESCDGAETDAAAILARA